MDSSERVNTLYTMQFDTKVHNKMILSWFPIDKILYIFAL